MAKPKKNIQITRYYCDGRYRYKSKKKARQGGFIFGSSERQCYKCKACGDWHLKPKSEDS